MLIIELTYKKPLNEVEKYLQDHRDFLSKYYDQGVFLASGPKDPRDGGIILANCNDADEIIKEDPFYQHQIADYKVIRCNFNRSIDELTMLINDQ